LKYGLLIFCKRVQVQDDLPYRKLYYFYNLVLTKSAQLQKTEKMGEKKN